MRHLRGTGGTQPSATSFADCFAALLAALFAACTRAMASSEKPPKNAREYARPMSEPPLWHCRAMHRHRSPTYWWVLPGVLGCTLGQAERSSRPNARTTSSAVREQLRSRRAWAWRVRAHLARNLRLRILQRRPLHSAPTKAKQRRERSHSAVRAPSAGVTATGGPHALFVCLRPLVLRRQAPTIDRPL